MLSRFGNYQNVVVNPPWRGDEGGGHRVVCWMEGGVRRERGTFLIGNGVRGKKGRAEEFRWRKEREREKHLCKSHLPLLLSLSDKPCISFQSFVHTLTHTNRKRRKIWIPIRCQKNRRGGERERLLRVWLILWGWIWQGCHWCQSQSPKGSDRRNGCQYILRSNRWITP